MQRVPPPQEGRKWRVRRALPGPAHVTGPTNAKRLTVICAGSRGVSCTRAVDCTLQARPGVRFNVTMIDPLGNRFAHFLFDLARYLVHTLESLGHDCTLERNACVRNATNILVGSHMLGSPADAKALLGPARSYVVFWTELLGDGTINGQPARDRLDQIVFPLFRGARAIWSGTQVGTKGLVDQGIASQVVRFGYHPAMTEIVHKRNRDIDFLFFGSVTPWRRTVLTELERLGYRVHVDFDAVGVYRNDLIARSEVVLTLRQSEAQNQLPWTRILYCVNNRSLVVGEGGLEQEAFEDVFVWTNEPKDLIELCRETRARDDRRELAEKHHETLRSRPMTELLAPLVARLE